MASVGGSKSLQISSDETFDQICGPCNTDGVQKEARYYCQDCRQELCDACKDYHRKLTTTRNHVIVPGHQVPASLRGGTSLVPCGCNKNQRVEFYCETHQDFTCSSCKSFHHRKCKTSNIQEKSSSYRPSSLDPTLSKIKSLEGKYDRLKQARGGADKDLKRFREDCKKDIKAFRKELDAFLDNLEKNMLAELDQWETEEHRRIDQHISELTTALKVLQADCKMLEDTKRNKEKEMMYIADVRVSRALQGYESRFDDLENDYAKPTLAFGRNKILANLKNNVDALGYLLKKRANRADKASVKTVDKIAMLLLGRHIQSTNKVNVRSRDDRDDPLISGCTVMPNGHVVLCDYQNNKIKLLDSSWALTGSLLLPDPWDISIVDGNNVIVTSLNTKQLQYVQVFPQLKAGQFIQLDKKCWGIHVCGGEIYVTCHYSHGEGEVRVFGRDGELRRRLGINKDGSLKFTMPEYITVNPSGEKIFVSDYITATITCMTSDGRVVYSYNDNDMEYPRGLYCDSGDNILVCSVESNNVQVITADGKKSRTLLTNSDGLYQPHSIVYRETDDTLVVGCSADSMCLYKLTK